MNKKNQYLNIKEFLEEIKILNSYYKINPRIKSKLLLKNHKYFVKMIKRLKIIGIIPFKNLNHDFY